MNLYHCILFSSFSSSVNRSLICTIDPNDSFVVNRSSSSASTQWRAVDIKNSLEYRELEKTNKSLSEKIENLKEALVKERKERKKMQDTHMCKPLSRIKD